MAPSENRREHPRWKLEKDVFCYIDGIRMDARCENISTGGLFIRTTHQNELPVGALVGLTFRTKDGSGAATFLFGRIVRRVSGRSGGVGLKWEKAVTVGPRTELAGFLLKIFKIEHPEIREEPVGKGQTRSVFHFPPQGASKLIPLMTGPATTPSADTQTPEKSGQREPLVPETPDESKPRILKPEVPKPEVPKPEVPKPEPSSV
ncbi:MAG: PilZ domain-containing protein, partial [Deltaproteobacteria bacterium]|nr:PilZ domain-containing protein [Deltaproteobacteria bacterium]